MQTINDAIKELHQDLLTTGFNDGLIDKVAEGWEINPKLLTRMFEQKYGKHPKDFNCKITNVETNYEEIYNRSIRTVRDQKHFFWSNLTPAEQTDAKKVIDRYIISGRAKHLKYC